MPKRPGAIETGLLPVGSTSGRLLTPDDTWQQVENFFPTPEGTYRSAYKPQAFLRLAGGGIPTNGAEDVSGPVYGATRGIYHGMLQGGHREVILLHTGQQIWAFEGWNRAWRCLIGPASASPDIEATLPEEVGDNFLTQFIHTPTGVVINPMGYHAFFYDGHVVAELGFKSRPSAPTGRGPESGDDQYTALSQSPGLNDIGYIFHALRGRPGALHPIFKYGRMGTMRSVENWEGIDNMGNSHPPQEDYESKGSGTGEVLRGEYRFRYANLDRWGNIGPSSPSSNPVTWRREPARGWVSGTPTAPWLAGDHALRGVVWESIEPGPPHTIGRIGYQTKDLINSGDAEYYELPLNATAIEGEFATLPDNVSYAIPANIPDAWLVNRMPEIDPTPQFRVACMAFGRLWIGNILGREGTIRPSMPGRWGTFESNKEIVPDPTGAAITGMAAVRGGLLVLTERSAFLIVPNDSGDGFRPIPLSTTVGCVAPGSLAVTRWGQAIWLSEEGFHGYSGGAEPEYLFDEWRERAAFFNKATWQRSVAYFDSRTGEYRCWVPHNTSRAANRMWQYDGSSWRWYTTSAATGCCRMQNHTSYGLICGEVGGVDGVWVMDVGGADATATLNTGWVRAFSAKDRASIRHVTIWLRESAVPDTDAAKLQVTIERDWRAGDKGAPVVELAPVRVDAPRFSGARREDVSDDNSAVWGVDVWGGSEVRWRRRRPFVTRADIAIPDCEVFRLRLSSSTAWEIIGLTLHEDNIKGKAGRQR